MPMVILSPPQSAYKIALKLNNWTVERHRYSDEAVAEYESVTQLQEAQ